MENNEFTVLNKDENEAASSDENSFVEIFFWFLDLIGVLLVGMALMWTFCFRTMRVVGDSMQETFQPKNNVMVSNLCYKPKVGDVVVVNAYDLLEKTIIKRVIAKEHDIVEIDDEGFIFVNGKKIDEPYLKPGLRTMRNDFPKGLVEVPADNVFVLGDNRPVSGDSRIYGFFREDKLVGKVILRFWPFTKFKFF